MKVLQFPLARITVGFIIGIITAYYIQPSPTYVFLAILLLVPIFIGSYFWVQKKKKNFRFFGLLVIDISFLIGLSTEVIHTEKYQENHYTHFQNIFEKSSVFTVVLSEKLRSSINKDRFIASVESIDNKKSFGNILLNIRKDSIKQLFLIGNRLQFEGKIIPNASPKNPNQFDYGKYLANKQIYGQLFVGVEEIKISSIIQKDSWYYTAKVRNTIVENLKKQGFNLRELNVAIALILGQQQDIDPEIIKDYQYAGAVHILSVSGLHIGFILMFINFILKPIPNNRKGSFIKMLLIVIGLWSFGILAGLAPSVVRSVTMFSFVAVGQHLRRSVNIFHTLLISMLLILLVRPSFLFDVGFQLSYLALFFILWLHPLLSKVWKPKHKITIYIWELLSVSFAAQIGTLPLSLYYFHQFPGLFFVTNLIIIPLTGIVMGIGVAVMCLALIDACPVFLAKILEWFIWFVDLIIAKIASFEAFILKDISFSFTLLLASYLFIFAMIIWFKKPKYNYFVLVLVSIIFVQSTIIYQKWQQSQEQEWVVFDAKKTSLIAERNADKATFYTSENLKKVKENRLITDYLVGNSSQIQSVKSLPNVAYFNKNKILVIDSLGIYPPSCKPDILVLTQSPKLNLERLLLLAKPKIVIADGTNYKKLQKLWANSCEKQKIPFHATGEKGYYVLRK